jgi:hypothetical protein
MTGNAQHEGDGEVTVNETGLEDKVAATSLDEQTNGHAPHDRLIVGVDFGTTYSGVSIPQDAQATHLFNIGASRSPLYTAPILTTSTSSKLGPVGTA